MWSYIVMTVGIGAYIISRADPYMGNWIIRWFGNVMGMVAVAILLATIWEQIKLLIKEEHE